VRGVLSPFERASEVLFGLIMALTITGALNVVHATERETRALFVGTLACNVAWGLVDAVMYVLNTLFERGRQSVVARALGIGTDTGRTRELLAEFVPESFVEALSTAEVATLRSTLLGEASIPAPARLQGSDLLAALGVFLLVVASTFPVALPFLVMSDAASAMAVSRGLSLLLLFASGYVVGRYAGLRPFLVGLAMLGVGAVLVAAVMALGG